MRRPDSERQYLPERHWLDERIAQSGINEDFVELVKVRIFEQLEQIITQLRQSFPDLLVDGNTKTSIISINFLDHAITNLRINSKEGLDGFVITLLEVLQAQAGQIVPWLAATPLSSELERATKLLEVTSRNVPWSETKVSSVSKKFWEVGSVFEFIVKLPLFLYGYQIGFISRSFYLGVNYHLPGSQKRLLHWHDLPSRLPSENTRGSSLEPSATLSIPDLNSNQIQPLLQLNLESRNFAEKDVQTVILQWIRLIAATLVKEVRENAPENSSASIQVSADSVYEFVATQTRIFGKIAFNGELKNPFIRVLTPDVFSTIKAKFKPQHIEIYKKAPNKILELSLEAYSNGKSRATIYFYIIIGVLADGENSKVVIKSLGYNTMQLHNFLNRSAFRGELLTLQAQLNPKEGGAPGQGQKH